MKKIDKLRLLMYQQHLSQAKLAKSLGISEKALSQKMQGKVDFWWREVDAICDAVGIENPRQYFKEKN